MLTISPGLEGDTKH